MRISNLLILSSVLSLSIGSMALAQEKPLRQIEGTFLQFQPWMMKLDNASWKRELDAMREAGLELVVIQWLQFENTRFIPADASSKDPVGVVMDYADKHGMRIFLGLTTDERWHERMTVPRYLDRAVAVNIKIAESAWARYGRHRSLAGWYIPQELRYMEYSPENVEMLRNFYRKQSDRLREISGKKIVAVAPAIPSPREEIEPEKFASVICGILSGSGIDMIFLQDGVGAHRGRGSAKEIVPYFRAMRSECRKRGISLWADLEIFKRKDRASGSEPAPLERIRSQIEAEAPFVDGFAMFDFFHYMSPYRGEAQRALFEEYLREIARVDSIPAAN